MNRREKFLCVYAAGLVVLTGSAIVWIAYPMQDVKEHGKFGTQSLTVGTPNVEDTRDEYEILPPALPLTTCQEDDPCWDCTTMGNLVCGPNTDGLWSVPGADLDPCTRYWVSIVDGVPVAVEPDEIC